MTGDLREAFHVAAVSFVGWHRDNEEQARWGWINTETHRREYLPEPTVNFFGRAYTITEICELAKVLHGPLPAHIRALFVVIDDGSGEPVAASYSEAVEALAAVVDIEKDRQTRCPIEDPPQADRIRDQAYREGAADALAAILKEAGRS